MAVVKFIWQNDFQLTHLKLVTIGNTWSEAKRLAVNLQLSDIIHYVEFYKRLSNKNVAAFKTGHVFMGYFSDVVKNRITRLCVPSAKFSALPHQLNIKLSATVDNWVCR